MKVRVETRTIRMLPNVSSSGGIENVVPTQQTTDSARGALNFMRTFSRELFAQCFETGLLQHVFKIVVGIILHPSHNLAAPNWYLLCHLGGGYTKNQRLSWSAFHSGVELEKVYDYVRRDIPV
jgi:hypothetical protein